MKRYLLVLRRPGALRFSSAGLVARLPIAMIGLGIVLLVEAGSGSYALAGTVSAAYMIANALLAIVQGRLLDKVGQGPVLAVASIVFGVSLSLLTVAVEADWPVATWYAAAAVAGGTLPQIGSAVRARWSHVLDQPAEVQTAYALEAVLDEVCFVLGPILVTVLATTVDPVLGVVAALVTGVVGGLAFAAQRGTAPPVAPRHEARGPRPPMPWRTVVPLVVVTAALGVLFGSIEVTTVAFSEEQGTKAYAGGLLALYALGSLLAGVVTGAMTLRRGPAARVRIGAVGMAAAMVPLFLIDSVPLMGLVLLVGGAAIAPTLIATMSLTEASVPRARLTEGMAVMHTGLLAGVAPGAAVAGYVIDHSGASAAYLVPLVAGLVAVVAAQSVPRDADSLEAPASPEPVQPLTPA